MTAATVVLVFWVALIVGYTMGRINARTEIDKYRTRWLEVNKLLQSTPVDEVPALRESDEDVPLPPDVADELRTEHRGPRNAHRLFTTDVGPDPKAKHPGVATKTALEAAEIPIWKLETMGAADRVEIEEGRLKAGLGPWDSLSGLPSWAVTRIAKARMNAPARPDRTPVQSHPLRRR